MNRLLNLIERLDFVEGVAIALGPVLIAAGLVLMP